MVDSQNFGLGIALVIFAVTFHTKVGAFFTLEEFQQAGWPAVAARSWQPAGRDGSPEGFRSFVPDEP